jgi:hypothetical protein
VATQPGPPSQWRGSAHGDTAELKRRPQGRRRRPLLAILFALLGLAGLVVAGTEIRTQLKPRTFTAAQQRKIRAWEVARRWRVLPKPELFPAVIRYRLTAGPTGQGKSETLGLKAKRLEIAREASCERAAGGSRKLMSRLERDNCLALLRSTYTDASGSLVVTAGIAVLAHRSSSVAAARYLTGGSAAGQGRLSRQLVLRPFRVGGTSAALFGFPQRQLSWVVSAGPYLVMATVGYADGRSRVPISQDKYIKQEMMDLAEGVAFHIAAPLAARPPRPACPGVPGC